MREDSDINVLAAIVDIDDLDQKTICTFLLNARNGGAGD
jgi:hypothetical protein